MKRKISVILPVFNSENTLTRCLDSLLAQTYPNFEVLVIDDGSDDSSRQIVSSYANKDNRIKIYYKENKGVSSARNDALDLALGEFITFLDADDWLEEDALQYMINLQERTSADLVVASYHRTSKLSSKVSTSKNVKEQLLEQDEYVKKFLKIESQSIEYYPWNKLYKASILKSIRFVAELRIAEDVPFVFEYILYSKIIAISDKITYNYYNNPKSVTATFTDKKFDVYKAWAVVEKINTNPIYDKWIDINIKRIDLSLLMMLAMDKNFYSLKRKYANQIKEMLIRLKKSKKSLLVEKISLNRKMLIILFCSHYAWIASVIHFIVRFKNYCLSLL